MSTYNFKIKIKFLPEISGVFTCEESPSIPDWAKTILSHLGAIMAQLDDLETKVAANTDVTQSAVILLKGLHDELIAAGTDPVKLKALGDKLQSNTDTLAQAVAENTDAG